MNKKRRSASGAYQELGQTLLRLSKLKQTSHYSHLQNDRPDHEILIYTELHLTVFSSQATSVSPVAQLKIGLPENQCLSRLTPQGAAETIIRSVRSITLFVFLICLQSRLQPFTQRVVGTVTRRDHVSRDASFQILSRSTIV